MESACFVTTRNRATKPTLLVLVKASDMPDDVKEAINNDREVSSFVPGNSRKKQKTRFC